MVSERVTIEIDVNTTKAQVSIEEVKAKADAVTRRWKIDRAILIQQVREGLTLISSLMSSFRMAMSLFGQQIDPFFGALVGMVLATTSMLISAATTLTATVIGGPLAAVIFGLAISFNILSIAKLVADKEKADGILTNMVQSMAASAAKNADMLGGF